MTTKIKEKPKHLGRGLASLLSPIIAEVTDSDGALSKPVFAANFPPDKQLDDSMREISIEEILPNPYQPRTTWDQQELADLAESIRSNGVIQPIIVRPWAATIASTRRLKCAWRARLSAIPCAFMNAWMVGLASHSGLATSSPPTWRNASGKSPVTSPIRASTKA